MTKAALGISAVIFPPFFCGAFASYSRYNGMRTYLYHLYDFVPPPSIDLNKDQKGPTILRGKNTPF